MAETIDVDRAAVAFVRVLRGSGLEVALPAVTMFADALRAVGFEQPSRVYWAGRATLVHRPEDIEVYDRAFVAFWKDAPLPAAIALVPPVDALLAVDTDVSGDDATAPEAGPLGPVVTVRFSPREILRHKDFAEYTHAEHVEARRLMADARLAGARRRSRRHKPVRGVRSGRPDLRRTMRQALRTGGEPIRRAWQEPGERPRRVVFICDVSGSMESYSRSLLRFVQAAAAGRGRNEVFALGTRLTRVTRELAHRDPDAALAQAGRRVQDWSGGTRLGEGLRAFNDRWGQRGLARGAVVVILSDGWDRGDPAVLEEQLRRLRRVAYRVVWVNPLKAAPGYAPLARGMAIALPLVDDFVEGHSVAALEHLAEVIAR